MTYREAKKYKLEYIGEGLFVKKETLMKKLILLFTTLCLLSGCGEQNKLKVGTVVENPEDYCYSEKEVWEEFEKRGFKEDNITVMNFFGEQNPSTIYSNYNMNFEYYSDDGAISKESDTKHPSYNFLYITGDFKGYLEDTQELIAPSIYGGEYYGFWSISILGNSWVAYLVPSELQMLEDDSYKQVILYQKGINFISNNNLTVVDFKEDFMNSEEYLAYPDGWILEEVDLITEEVLSKYAKKYQHEVKEIDDD